MRIIAGSLGGRKFDSPRSNRTHPMADKVRGALFNTLGDIDGLTLLDAFSGTGALSFEAVSRGAQSALAIENDRPAQQSIAEAIRTLGVGGQVRLVQAGVSGWSDNNPDRRFDLVMADPPYDLADEPLAEVLERLRAGWLAPGATVVIERPTGAARPSGWVSTWERCYGDTLVWFLQTE